MKIVFVQPNVGFKGHTWEALGVGYIISYLRQNSGHEHEISFYSAFYDSDESIVDACSDADVIAFTCTSPQYRHGLSLAGRVKTEANKVVFGGVHPSALPHDVVKEPCIDAVVQGEGERSMLRIVDEMEADHALSRTIYNSAYIEDLNAVPFPDRKTIKNERNIDQAYRDNGSRITSVLSSRGCPYRCSFCCSSVVWKRVVRFRSPGNILDEFEDVQRDYKIQFIKFADDTFTVNKKRILDFCDQKLERGITLPYGANAHLNTMDEEMIRRLAESNCQELWYGVESGSPKILKAMHKNITIEEIKAKFQLTKDYGIKTRAYFLLGTPNETIEDIRMTEALCDDIQPDIVGFTLLAPYPINEYYDYDEMSDWDWSTFDEYGNDWVHTKTLTNGQLKEEQRRLVEKFISRATFKHKV